MINKIIEIAFSGFWPFVVILVLLNGIAYFIINALLRIWSRFMRMLMVRKHGWPPAHLDADGDWNPELKASDDVPIKAKFSHITKRYEKTYNVIFKASDGTNLNTICKWIKNSDDVNRYISLDNGYVIGCNDEGKYFISEGERLKAVIAVENGL